ALSSGETPGRILQPGRLFERPGRLFPGDLQLLLPLQSDPRIDGGRKTKLPAAAEAAPPGLNRNPVRNPPAANRRPGCPSRSRSSLSLPRPRPPESCARKNRASLFPENPQNTDKRNRAVFGPRQSRPAGKEIEREALPIKIPRPYPDMPSRSTPAVRFHHPFTAPAANPFTTFSWEMKYATSRGSVPKTRAAMIPGTLTENSP